jgi:DNA topoisomerase IA
MQPVPSQIRWFLESLRRGRKTKRAEEKNDEEEERNLPAVQQGETLKLNSITPEQHFTEPPPRYSEATLVKRSKKKASAARRRMPRS